MSDSRVEEGDAMAERMVFHDARRTDAVGAASPGAGSSRREPPPLAMSGSASSSTTTARPPDSEPRVLMSGVDALVRLLVLRQELDRREGLDTATMVSGYPGSPLGTFDLAVEQAEAELTAHKVIHRPGSTKSSARRSHGAARWAPRSATRQSTAWPASGTGRPRVWIDPVMCSGTATPWGRGRTVAWSLPRRRSHGEVVDPGL